MEILDSLEKISDHITELEAIKEAARDHVKAMEYAQRSQERSLNSEISENKYNAAILSLANLKSLIEGKV